MSRVNFLIISDLFLLDRIRSNHRPCTPEQRGDLYMARKMYREAIDTYSANAKTRRFYGTRSASRTISWVT